MKLSFQAGFSSCVFKTALIVSPSLKLRLYLFLQLQKLFGTSFLYVVALVVF